jgi:hypothetical protein
MKAVPAQQIAASSAKRSPARLAGMPATLPRSRKAQLVPAKAIASPAALRPVIRSPVSPTCAISASQTGIE